MNKSESLATTIRPLTSDDAQSYSALRRQIAAESSIGLGLTLEEEFARPIQEFADQLAASPPNLMLGAFEGSTLIATAGIARPTMRQPGAHKAVLWGVPRRPPTVGAMGNPSSHADGPSLSGCSMAWLPSGVTCRLFPVGSSLGQYIMRRK